MHMHMHMHTQIHIHIHMLMHIHIHIYHTRVKVELDFWKTFKAHCERHKIDTPRVSMLAPAFSTSFIMGNLPLRAARDRGVLLPCAHADQCMCIRVSPGLGGRSS